MLKAVDHKQKRRRENQSARNVRNIALMPLKRSSEMLPRGKKSYDEFNKPSPSPWAWENFAYGTIVGIIILLIMASVA